MKKISLINFHELTQPHFYKKKNNIIWVCTEETPFWIRRHIYKIRPMVLLVAFVIQVIVYIFPNNSVASQQGLCVIALIMLYMHLCSVSFMPDWDEAKKLVESHILKEWSFNLLKTGTVFLFEECYDALKADLFRVGQGGKLKYINAAQNTNIPVVVHRGTEDKITKFYCVYNIDTMREEVIMVESKEFDRWQRMALIRSGYPMDTL